MDSTIYFEVFVLVDVLLSDVFCDHLVRHVSGTATEVAPCPYVSPPKLLLEVWKLGKQMVRRLSF